MIKKRVSALLFALAFLLIVFSCFACNTGKTPTDGTTGEQGSADSAPVSVIRNGKPAVTLIRSEFSSESEIKAMTDIRNTVMELWGEYPEVATDDVLSGKGVKTEYLILIGKTVREESRTAANRCAYGDFTVTVQGKAIVLYTHINDEITMAANAFCAYLRNQKGKENVSFAAADEICFSAHPELNRVPVMENAFPNACAGYDLNSYQFLYNLLGEAEVTAYGNRLSENGFEQLTEREVANIRFTSYLNRQSNLAVAVQYDKTVRTLRLLIGNGRYQFVQDENRYTAVTTPLLAMMGDTADSVTGLCGLECMMIRLSDGRFIMIDGGVASKGFADKIYNTMVAQSGGQKHVTVAAWFFSHAHNDHVGGFQAICSYYSEYVTIENVFYNFPSSSTARAMESGTVSEMSKVKENLAKYYPDTKINKVHMGDLYRIADATVEVFYTPEEYLKEGRTLSQSRNFNETSLIFSVDIGGQRIMFLGDAQEICNNETASRFGSLLKSDFVQVAHHGGVGGTAEIYAAVNAQVALITTDDSRVEAYMSASYNQAMLNHPNMKEWYNVHNRVYIWDLPYVPTGHGLQP